MQAITQRGHPGLRQPVSRPARTQPATPDALNLLEQFGITVSVAREHEIYPEGADALYCYRLVSGCVRIVKLMEDGRRQVSAFLMPGDWLGLNALDTHDVAAEALCDTVLRRYSRRMVETLADGNASLSRRLREIAGLHLRAVHEQTILLGRKTATERLASFLLEMDGRLGTQQGRRLVELPMARADVADHLGLTVETVCRILASLKREGTVAIARSGVEVRDRAALRILACEAQH